MAAFYPFAKKANILNPWVLGYQNGAPELRNTVTTSIHL